MPTAESQQGLREKLNKEGVDSILAVCSSSFLANETDRGAATTEQWIRTFMSDHTYAISDDLAKKLERVLSEIDSHRKNQKRTFQQDSFGKVGGASPTIIPGEEDNLGKHPADRD
ncbi:MAG: hypothetical protein HZA34_04685 [Candidatus Pacebacteria bacterium]|nr:hypothetical protein [Candidatus Paceibacterota bacterium]